jgi:hypothetical protein
MNLAPEDSLNTLNLQILLLAFDTIKADYGLEIEMRTVSILNIGCAAINRTTPMTQFHRQWNLDTFQYLGPYALVKIMYAILKDAMDSIQRKIIISLQNTRALEFIIFYIRATHDAMMYISFKIPTQHLYFIDESTNLRAIMMNMRLE